jgi:histidyl-tRNA synthetase
MQNKISNAMCYEERSFKSQLKKGIDSNARYLLIIGESEYLALSVTVKNTETQEQEIVKIDDLVAFLKQKGEKQ